MQALKPSINMNFPEYSRINQTYDVSVLVDDLLPETLKNALEKLTQNPAFYRQLQENCLQASEIFVWEKEAEKLIHFYTTLFDST